MILINNERPQHIYVNKINSTESGVLEIRGICSIPATTVFDGLGLVENTVHGPWSRTLADYNKPDCTVS
jgi:hypothetical protein